MSEAFEARPKSRVNRKGTVRSSGDVPVAGVGVRGVGWIHSSHYPQERLVAWALCQCLAGPVYSAGDEGRRPEAEALAARVVAGPALWEGKEFRS